MPPLNRVKSPGQGSLEYLLLIGGAVLVVVVVLLLLITSVIPMGELFLQNRLSNVPNTIPGNSGNNPPAPPAYSGPLLMDWSNVSGWDYASFAIDNYNNPFTADPPKLVSNVLLSNTGTNPLTLTHVRPTFALTIFSSSPLSLIPTKISSLDVFTNDASNTFLFSLTDLDSGVAYALPPNTMMDPSLGWKMVARFDEPILPVEQSFYIFPAEHAFSFSLAWTDSSGVVHRPSEWNSILVYEKGFVAGALDSRIAACDGSGSPTTSSTVGVITDWCIGLSPGPGCAYVRDLGYSTVFALPSPLPSNASLLDTRLLMTHLDTIVQGEGAYADADPYTLIKTPASCDGLIFDTVEDISPTYSGAIGTSSPQDGDGDRDEVKWFDADGLFSPGEGEASLTIVGEDSPAYPSPDVTSEGLRLWQTGYSFGNPTPAPFLLLRFARPI